jgi:hypothetical protein
MRGVGGRGEEPGRPDPAVPPIHTISSTNYGRDISDNLNIFFNEIFVLQ